MSRLDLRDDMPMLLSEVDSVCEGDLNLMSSLGGLTATADVPATADLPATADVPAADSKPFLLDTLDDLFAPDWESMGQIDEVIAAFDAEDWPSDLLIDDQHKNREFHETDKGVKSSVSINTTSASSTTSKCKNSIAGSSSTSSSTVAAASSNNGVVNSSTLTVTSASNSGCSSRSVSTVGNSNACVINSNNVVNSSMNNSVVSSSSVSSSKGALVEITTPTVIVIRLPKVSAESEEEEVDVLSTSDTKQIKLILKAQCASSKKLQQTLSNKRKLRKIDDLNDTLLPTNKAKAHGGLHETSYFTGDKRHLHNKTERKRRVEMQNAFKRLRGLVPSLMDQRRAPKRLILEDAVNYCTELKTQSNKLSTEVDALRKRQEYLKSKVSVLRRLHATYR